MFSFQVPQPSVPSRATNIFLGRRKAAAGGGVSGGSAFWICVSDKVCWCFNSAALRRGLR